MSSTGANKNWLYALGAGVALVATAVLWHVLANKEESEGSAASSNSKVLLEIDALGPPQREMNGMLKFPYYKDVFFII